MEIETLSTLHSDSNCFLSMLEGGDIQKEAEMNGVHEDLHIPIMRHRKCQCTWMYEQCETGKALASQVHEASLKKVRTQLPVDIQVWQDLCQQLHEHIASAEGDE